MFKVKFEYATRNCEDICNDSVIISYGELKSVLIDYIDKTRLNKDEYVCGGGEIYYMFPLHDSIKS